MADAQGDEAAVSYPINFYNDPTLSDVQIKFSGHTIYAHKFALSRESRNFHKASTGSFIEAKSDHIDLHDEDDPECVIIMLKHIYGVETFPTRPSWERMSIESAKNGFNFLPKLFVPADKYDVPKLRGAIVSEFIQSFAVLPHAYYGDEGFCNTFKSVFEHVGSNAMQDALLAACCPKTVEMMAYSAFKQMLSDSGGLASEILANMTIYLLKDCSRVWFCKTCKRYVDLYAKCTKCKSGPPPTLEVKGRVWDLN